MVTFLKATKIYRLLRLLNRGYGFYKWPIALLAVLGVFGGLLEGVGINAVIPLFSFITGASSHGNDFISKFIEGLFDLANIKFSLRYLLVFIFILFLVRAAALLFNNYLKVKIAMNYSERMRNMLFGKMIGSDWPNLLKQKLGHLETVLMTNVHYSESLLQAIAGIVMVSGGLLMYLLVAINISFPITVVTIGLAFIIFFLFKPILDHTRRLSGSLEHLNREIAHFVNEHVIGMKPVKAMIAENPVMERGRALFAALKRLRFKVFLLGILPDSLLQPIGLMFVLVIFAFSYKTPNFSIAALAAVVYLIERIFIYIQQLQKLFQSVSEYAPYLESVLHFEDQSILNREKDGGKEKFSFSKSVDFKHVVFTYSPNENKVFTDLNFTVHQGEMVGVVGPSGVGKTTVVDLLLRFFNPTAGEILIDGKAISNVELRDWRKNIGYISQDIFLLNDTIENNIRFYDETVTHEDIVRAAKMADIYDFIESVPKKFHTEIGERGIMLSAGQRQRVIIARVLSRNPKFLILDEATSALDNQTEREIQAVIERLKGVVTVIVIAHRLSTVMKADKVLVIDNGGVCEEGEPAALLNNPESYFYKLNKTAK